MTRFWHSTNFQASASICIFLRKKLGILCLGLSCKARVRAHSQDWDTQFKRAEVSEIIPWTSWTTKGRCWSCLCFVRQYHCFHVTEHELGCTKLGFKHLLVFAFVRKKVGFLFLCFRFTCKGRGQEHAVRIETASLRESMSESFECHEQNKVDVAFVFLCAVRDR